MDRIAPHIDSPMTAEVPGLPLGRPDQPPPGRPARAASNIAAGAAAADVSPGPTPPDRLPAVGLVRSDRPRPAARPQRDRSDGPSRGDIGQRSRSFLAR